jgi:hypothetical protein
MEPGDHPRQPLEAAMQNFAARLPIKQMNGVSVVR